MADHVLVPLDGSEPSWKALDYVIETFEDVTITVLHVINPTEWLYSYDEEGYYDEDARELARERAEELCEEARQRVEPEANVSGIALECVIETGRPEREISASAEDHDVDQIVMGSHGRSGISRVLLGSVAESVTRRASVPVTIVR